MGRKGAGRSSFVKATLRHKESGSDSGEEVDAAATLHGDSPAESCSPPHPPPRTQAAEAEAAAARSTDGSSESEEKGAESMGRILQRHKGELRAVRDQARRLGKKRADEAAAMEATVLARHRTELAAAEARQAEARALRPSNLRSLAQDLARAHLEKKMDGDDEAEAKAEEEDDLTGIKHEEDEDGEGSHASAARPKQSKAARRRQQRCQQEREREERIAREQAERGASEREVEEAAISEHLALHELAIHQIPPDGHCMFRALEHQLGRRAGERDHGSSANGKRDTVGGLRKMAASYMRRHAERFEPFVADEEGGLEAYCARLEDTAAWGGHPELVALSEALPAKILLYSAESQEPQTFGPDGADVLRVCFLKHAFGLGEHYESVVEKGEE